MLANRLVKLCSPACVQEVNENPARFFAMLDGGTLDIDAEEEVDRKED